MATNGVDHSVSKSNFTTSSTIPLWLDGKEVTTSKTSDVTSPVNHKTVYKSAAATQDDVQAALAAAERAQDSWAKTKPYERRDIFLKVADEMERRKEEFWAYSRTDTGVEWGMFDYEFGVAVDGCRTIAGLVSTVQGTVINPKEHGRSAMMLREPYGVVLSIAPWNAPYALGIRSFLLPLAAGNTVVLKGPESAPAPYWALASAFHNAGLPAGCLNTIIHQTADASAITTALVSSHIVKKVTFTGSTAVGSIIATLAGKHLKPVLMELGGKAPSIVCEDANLETAAFHCALGSFLHSGQICMSTERILVHKAIASDFKQALKKAMDEMWADRGQGAPILVGTTPVQKNKKLLSDAVSKGAKVLYGDYEHDNASATRMKPVIIENVREGMDIYHTESFGPTVSIFEIDSDDEAIRIANDTEYGLSSAVFTEDLRRGFSIAKAIETGAVHINSMSVHDEAGLPHGGAKKSGYGRFNGREGTHPLRIALIPVVSVPLTD